MDKKVKYVTQEFIKRHQHYSIWFYIFVILIIAFPNHAIAQTLSISVGWNKPPYVIEETNSGFELDMVSAIVASIGYYVSYVYVPFGRSNTLIKVGKVDAALTMNQRMDINNLVLSQPYISYQNAVISLKGRSIKINSVSDLKSYSIVAFQNASVVLGRDYQQVANISPLYLELPDQRKQVEMLLKGKVDLVVMDINIFNYFSRKLVGSSHISNVDIHRLFPKTHYNIAFTKQTLMLEFNKAMKAYKQSDDYTHLVAKYEFLY